MKFQSHSFAAPAGIMAVLIFLLTGAGPVMADRPSTPSPAQNTSGAALNGAAVDGLRGELRRVIGEARDRVFPALVSIRVVTVRYGGGREIKGQSVGSGTIISAEGHVLTNEHVVRNGRKFICTLSDKREAPATLIGEDPLTDLALLQLDLDALEGSSELPVAVFGDSDALEIGDYVMAMGSPYSLSRSVSLGIASNTERVFAGGFGSDDVEEMELEQGQRTGLFTRWIQHDAVISPGNSGGPLVNLKGEIIGVNELGSSTLSFAIPSNLAAKVTEALLSNGEVERSWTGMSFKSIRRTGFREGVLISSVVLESPAADAGVEAGDVLVQIDGEPLTVRFIEEVPLLLDRLASRPVGSTVEMALNRDGELFTTQMTLARLEKDLGEETALPVWGFSAQEITPKMARDWRLDSTDGVIVTGIRGGGAAQQAEPSLEYGDVLRQFNGKPMRSLEDLIRLYKDLTNIAEEQTDPDEVVVEFDRRGQSQLSLLKPRGVDNDVPPRELPKAWIGVATQPLLPPLAEYLGLEDERGFRVTRVYPQTEAAKAGLQVGDVITTVNDENLRPQGLQDAAVLARRIRGLDIDGTAQLRVLREGQTLELSVPLERTRLAKDEARRHDDKDFEISVRELTFFDRDENRWEPDLRGVLVAGVDPGGWAGLGGLRSGDLVLRVGDLPIRGLKSFRRAMKETKEQQPDRVVFVILRGTKTHFQYIEPDWTPTESL